MLYKNKVEDFVAAATYSMAILSYPLSQTVAAFVYCPMFHGLGITSAYEVIDFILYELN